jgi:hypothetical protein
LKVAQALSPANWLENLSATGTEFFEKRIRPVFAARCYVRHSASAPKIQGGLQLDSRDLLRKGGNSGPPIAPLEIPMPAC